MRAERHRLSTLLPGLPGVRAVLPSAANFLTVRFDDAARAYRAALSEGIVLRDVGHYPGLHNCLRIGIGAPEENDAVLDLLRTLRVAVA